MTTLDATKLAAMFREATRSAEDWRDALNGLADWLEDKPTPEPAEHWSDWFEWAGGECPLPSEVRTQIVTSAGANLETLACCFAWANTANPIVRFRYLADNPEGWVKRPEGWVPPGEARPLEAVNERGGHVLIKFYSGPLRTEKEWEGVTHIRLLPREPAKPPSPQPVPDVVREALEAADKAMRGHWGDPNVAEKWSLVPRPFASAWLKVGKALAALDEAPAEEVLGYAPVDGNRWIISTKPFGRADSARETYPHCTIVKLVVVKP